jgi:hypothetical protein
MEAIRAQAKAFQAPLQGRSSDASSSRSAKRILNARCLNSFWSAGAGAITLCVPYGEKEARSCRHRRSLD